MLRSSPFLLCVSAVSAMLPGPPRQCFDEYQCIFHRFAQPYGSRYSWDLRNLCAPAGSEYAAFQLPLPSASPAPGTYQQRIIFNVCGSVAGPAIAPYQQPPTDNNVNMTLPQPHSHGTSIQILDDPVSFEQGYNCPDTDTCDQATNPACIPGTLNYDASRTGTNPYTNQPIDHNPAMEARCAAANPPPACFVASTRCTGNIELLSYDDGNAPAFSLYDEGEAGGVTVDSPSRGINLTYTPSLAFSDQRFQCTAKDPRTGLPVVRTINLYIACAPDGYATDPLAVAGYTEQGQCQYYIQASHKLACGVPGDPYDPSAFPSFAPVPTAAPVAALGLNANQLVGAVVGANAGITVAIQTLVLLALLACFVPAATREAALDACCERACCCCCCCGGRTHCGRNRTLAAAARATSGAASPSSGKSSFRDYHAKTEIILPGAAGMFVGRPAVSERFAANPLTTAGVTSAAAYAPEPPTNA